MATSLARHSHSEESEYLRASYLTAHPPSQQKSIWFQNRDSRLVLAFVNNMRSLLNLACIPANNLSQNFQLISLLVSIRAIVSSRKPKNQFH